MKKLLTLLGLAVLLISCENTPIESDSPIVDNQVKDDDAAELIEEVEEVEEVTFEGIVSTITDEESMGCKITYSDPSGNKIYYQRACNTAFKSEISPDSRFLIYVDDYKIMLFDDATGEVIELMSVLDDTDGVSFFWSPDSRTIAMGLVNHHDPSYYESFSTKLYVLGLSEDAEMIRKDRYLYKIRSGCHDAGCNINADDLYFVDEDTLMYRTWDEYRSMDEYSSEEEDDSMLRTVEL